MTGESVRRRKVLPDRPTGESVRTENIPPDRRERENGGRSRPTGEIIRTLSGHRLTSDHIYRT